MVFSKKPFPGSLATTTGISVDVFSSSYLDVSVHWVSYSIKGFPFGYPWISRCFVFPHGVSLRFTSCFLCQGIRFILFILFVFFLFFLPSCLMSLPVWRIGLDRRSIQNYQYESTPYSFPEVNTFKLLSFISGRGIWTPDMQIMILLFLPTKLSRLQKKEESRALPLLGCSIGTFQWIIFLKFDLNYGSHKSSTYSHSKFHKSNSKWDRVVPSNVKKSNI